MTSDARFVRTLPPAFRERRLLHRGTLAMACPALTWLDGITIDEEEVLEADRRLTREAEYLESTGTGVGGRRHERRESAATSERESEAWTP